MDPSGAPCTQSTRPVNHAYVATESRKVATVAQTDERKGLQPSREF